MAARDAGGHRARLAEAEQAAWLPRDAQPRTRTWFDRLFTLPVPRTGDTVVDWLTQSWQGAYP